MSLFSFVLQSARHYWRGHLGLLLGAFLASAILSGSLLVGDSVRASLRRVAELRLGQVRSGVLGGDRWFTEQLARQARGGDWNSAPVIIATGSASAGSGKVRVNGAQVLGVDVAFWRLSGSGRVLALRQGEVALNEPLARKLRVKVGDTVLLRLELPGAISRDAPLSGSTNQDVTLRRKVGLIVGAEDFGMFQLVAAQTAPDTAFVALKDLQTQLEMKGRVNALLCPGGDDEVIPDAEAPGDNSVAAPDAGSLMRMLEQHKTLEDFGLNLKRVDGVSKQWEVSTSRVFLDRSVVARLREAEKDSQGVLTYLVNGIKSAKGGTPYSMITAVETASMQGTELSVLRDAGEPGIVISQWLAEDHGLNIGDRLELVYFVVGLGRELKQQTAGFTVRGILPMNDPLVNRVWTPEFPGVSDVDNCRDWEPGMPMDMKAIRDKDEKYWDDYKGTPKGFIALAEGQKLWSNRFGNLTAVRFQDSGQEESAVKTTLLEKLSLADIGLVVRDFKGAADAAAQGSVDFGGLFVGLSLFLIAAALVFAALLFLFTLERRAAQVGLLLALGWRPGQVRRALLGEAGVIAVVGAVAGVLGGEVYTRLALEGLRGAWSGAAQGLPLIYAGGFVTKLGAGAGAVLVVLLTLWWASRKMFRAQPRELLGDWGAGMEGRRRGKGLWRPLTTMLMLAGAIGLVFAGQAVKEPEAVAGMFFGSGMMLLIAGLMFADVWMRRDGGGLARTLGQMGMKNVSRRPARSLAVIGMMAGGIFLVTAVNAFRMSAGDVTARTSGTGGFALIGESSLPVYEDLNTKAGREAFGLDEELMNGVTVVPFRVRAGDDASCLNLNRAQNPVLVGVDFKKLDGRFSLAGGTRPEGELAALADQATAMWGLGKGVGDALDYLDAAGRAFEVQLAGLLAGSVLQGKMVISEAAFLGKYPDAAGYRFFLVDAPEGKAAEVSAHLTRQLEQRGLALEPAKQRLELFLSVQNTYIGIFTVLGGLGVLLGTAGLGIVVARHVLERRGELGLMQALGFLPTAVRRMVLGEHVALLLGGVALGVVCAVIAVWPGVLQGGGALPAGFLSMLVAGVLAFGLAVCMTAVHLAVRGNLIEAIRRE